VLGGSYELKRPQVAQAVDALLRTKEVIVDRANQVMKALRVFNRGSADFADCLIESTASSAGCEKTVTFDVRAAKSAGMTLIFC
jgi:predicted nucleic-acid-binding protein